LVPQAVQLALQRFHAPLKALGVKVATLESVDVAVDGSLGAEAGSVELGARGTVLVVRDHAPVVMHLAERFQLALEHGQQLGERHGQPAREREQDPETSG
jgi:hypothetical protein